MKKFVKFVTMGSSPRMRGALRGKEYMCVDPGIIPADAGSTVKSAVYCGQAGDHPRGCGEHLTPGERDSTALGSSPRMRGAQEQSSRRDARLRIIPADAGSTRSTRCSSTDSADHPRGCGEHRAPYRYLSASPGSSPRMRGARTVTVGVGSPFRIIPADAGSTFFIGDLIWRTPDHPHGSREQASRRGCIKSTRGPQSTLRTTHVIHSTD